MSKVTALRRPAEGFLNMLLAEQPRLVASPSTWINALRTEAVARLDVLTLPSLRDEEWRFTDISRLGKLAFSAVAGASRLEAADIAHWSIEEAGHRLVFVDGVHAPQLSSAASDRSVLVSRLSTALACVGLALRANAESPIAVAPAGAALFYPPQSSKNAPRRRRKRPRVSRCTAPLIHREPIPLRGTRPCRLRRKF